MKHIIEAALKQLKKLEISSVWWDNLDKSHQHHYIKMHPTSKFTNKIKAKDTEGKFNDYKIMHDEDAMRQHLKDEGVWDKNDPQYTTSFNKHPAGKALKKIVKLNYDESKNNFETSSIITYAKTKITSSDQSVAKEIVRQLGGNKLVRYGETAGKEVGTLNFKVGDKKVTVKTFNTNHFHDGFSFQVANELDAYKAAYCYRGSKWTKILPSQTDSSWLVSVYPTTMP